RSSSTSLTGRGPARRGQASPQPHPLTADCRLSTVDSFSARLFDAETFADDLDRDEPALAERGERPADRGCALLRGEEYDAASPAGAAGFPSPRSRRSSRGDGGLEEGRRNDRREPAPGG